MEFTTSWFRDTALSSWKQLIPPLNPRRILEIGSFEGAASCWLIDELASKNETLELHCVDTWSGGIEHQAGGAAPADMDAVQARFNSNVRELVDAKRSQGMRLTVAAHKGPSSLVLPQLLAQGLAGSFDFIYVDGSHQAPDVLTDAVLSFQLLRVGGLLGFDDYIWREDITNCDLLRCPKPAIDSFSNLFCRKLIPVPSIPLYQAYYNKISI